MKWAGGKRQLLPELLKYIPEYNTYYEIFLGAGALFFELQPSRAIINDCNSELMNVYEVISLYPKSFIIQLEAININTEEHYYSIRNMDRKEDWNNYSHAFKAARTLYLNKNGFNGLYRVNSKGQFNVPYGKHKNEMRIERELFLAINNYFWKNNIEILCTDFKEAVKTAQKGDFVFCDPPYYPISKTSSFTSYTQKGFKEEDHLRLHKVLCELDKKGINFLLCNSYCQFNLELYKDFNVIEVKANRCINSEPEKRGKIKELIVKNY